MTWRLAKSLQTLLSDVNQKWPHRSKVSDGTIGDAAHSARISDHNPNKAGVVCAVDITNDPVNGPAGHALANMLIQSRDVRIKYIISDAQICSGAGGPSPWVWRKYKGANQHRHHVHISVVADPVHYDDGREWKL